MDKEEKVQDIRQRLDELRNEAEDEGLQLVVSWQDEYGGMQSVQLGDSDFLHVTVKQ